jgi:hypothetical protein
MNNSVLIFQPENMFLPLYFMLRFFPFFLHFSLCKESRKIMNCLWDARLLSFLLNVMDGFVNVQGFFLRGIYGVGGDF